MLLGDLYDAKVRTTHGKTVGCVHEVYVENGKVIALGVGLGNMLERLLGRRAGHRIAWDKVVKIEKGVVTIEP